MKTKNTSRAIELTHVLKASATGEYPTEIQIAKTGYWETPWHGDFDLITNDFDAAEANFAAGKYRVNGTEPLPGTLDHNGGESPAAFRITNVYRVEDILWATVEWTALGKEKLDRDEYRYISFEYCTRANPMPNPENVNEMFVNVVTGATLTNDPLFKKLKPVMASAKGDRNNQEGENMDLKTIRAKKLEDLSAEEKTFLEENKAELTDEERSAFGITLEAEETDAEKTAREAQEAIDTQKVIDDKAAADAKENVKLEAAAKSLGMSLKDIKTLQADAKAGREAQTELLRTRLTASVTAQVARGAIKTDQLTAGVDLLMATAEGSRPQLLKFLEALPSNELLKAEAGHGDDVEVPVEVSAAEKELGNDFGNTPEEIAAYKKSEAEKEA